ncbi:MAG: IS66 family transposase [Phycisphaeraceae bacterium]
MDDPGVNKDVPTCPSCVVLQARVTELERRLEEVTAKFEASRRIAKRQAAPFSKGGPKPNPRVPGRKAGPEHGTHSHRTIPDTEPDQVIDVSLPPRCPHCQGPTRPDGLTCQHQLDIPRQPIHRRFDIHVGHCVRCGKRVQGRHELQTSDALGAAACQIGPDAQAAVVHLNKTCGLSHGKIADVFAQLLGLDLSRGGACRIMLRAARRCRPTYDAIAAAIPQAPALTADETGWRIGGSLAWLHALVSVDLTCYVIDRLRGFSVPRRILGHDFAGFLSHDGWRAYDRFFQAAHQTCFNHLLTRCRNMLEVASAGAVRFPRQIQGLLRDGLDLRDRYHAGEVGPRGLAIARGRLEHRLDDLLAPARDNPANQRLANHLFTHRRQMFTFLTLPWIDVPGAEATNWRGEQALRPAVVNRKVWGGNRTAAGAAAQATLMSVLRTWQQRSQQGIAMLHRVLCQPQLLPCLMPAGP